MTRRSSPPRHLCYVQWVRCIPDNICPVLKCHVVGKISQDYNAQVAVDKGSLLIIGCALSNHPNDSQEAEPTLSAIPKSVGAPEAAALDAGYFGPATLAACAKRGIEPYVATGRGPHHSSWHQRFAPLFVLKASRRSLMTFHSLRYL